MADGDSGLQLVDVSDPFDPALLESVATVDTALDVVVTEGLAFVADGWGDGGVAVVDVRDPLAPVLIGSMASPGAAEELVVEDGVAYLADNSSLLLIDVSSCRTCAGDVDGSGQGKFLGPPAEPAPCDRYGGFPP